jgi:hypothetical protein
VAGDGNVTAAGEHQSHSQLGNGLRGGTGGVLHGDAIGLSVLNVDVVYADTAADDQLQVAALSFVDVVGTNLGLGTDDAAIEIAQSLAQLFGSVELLNNFVATGTQSGDGGLIHTVGNENSHDLYSS